jgi:lipoprotein-releasing system ATP-binding protein
MAKEYVHGGQVLSVLRDVELHLAAGDMVAVVGASGVGKSTFLQILGTLDLPTRGSITFDGEEVTTMGPERLALFRNRKIGFVFQFHHLLPEFTALENVMMPGLIQRLPKAEIRRRAADVLGRVGLGKPPHPQALSSCRAASSSASPWRARWCSSPALLLADEPTGNLDRHTGEEIHQLFVELHRERGSTMLVVTHNLELARLMPRTLTMIDGGRLVPTESLGGDGLTRPAQPREVAP